MMRWPLLTIVLAALLLGAGHIDAQTSSAAGDPTLGHGLARAALPSALHVPPAPRPSAGGEYFSAAGAGAMRGGARRGVIIGAVVGGLAAGAFSYHLREDTGRSPLQEAAEPMLVGAVVGGLIGGAIGALLDR
jgi:hypothetical protein